MTDAIAVITDSAAMLPPEIAARRGIIVAPLTITVDGRDFLEGVEITANELYERVAAGATVSTSQPSPGRLLECYRQAAEGGATAIVSVHIGAGISGTLNSARTAAEQSPLPVTLIDTGQASFAEGLCVLEAADAVERGASIEEAAEAAEAAARRVGNTFIVKALDLLRRGGRLRDDATAPAPVPVLALEPDGIKVAGSAATLDAAVALMATHVERAALASATAGESLRVGIGNGAAGEIASALWARVATMRGVGEIIDYVVGPSMGAHLGPGNAGAVFISRAARPASGRTLSAGREGDPGQHV